MIGKGGFLIGIKSDTKYDDPIKNTAFSLSTPSEKGHYVY